MRFTILGAEGIGTAMGALIARVGNGVVLVSRSEPRAEEIRRIGLHLHGWDDFRVDVESSTTVPRMGDENVLLVATKSYDTKEALSKVTGYPRAVVPLQNGVEQGGPLVGMFGAAVALSSVIQVTAMLEGPGRVFCAGIDDSALSSNTDPELANELSEKFSLAGIPTRTVFNAVAVEWAKASQWIPSSLLAAATGMILADVLRHPLLSKCFVAMTRERAAVAAEVGHEIADFPGLYARDLLEGGVGEAAERLRRLGDGMARGQMSSYRSSMQLDLARGLSLELGDTAGAIESAAARVGLACPTLTAAIAIVTAKSEVTRRDS